MKKSLLALAALTAFAGVASAQSSVTAFGIVDLAARNVKNHSGSIKSLSSSGQATSRLGFRGIEDLGGGLRAGFWLESEVAPDTGAGGSAVSGVNTFWQRRATVSLMGGFGEVRLGRDLNVSYTSIGTFDPFGYVGVASLANVRGAQVGQGGATTGVRSSNTITYYLPAMGGLYGGVMVGAGEGTTNKYTGVRLGYAAGPLNISFATAKSEKAFTMVDDLTTTNVGASFNFGFATLGAAYEKNDYNNVDGKLATAYVTVPMGKGLLKAQFTETGGANAFSAKMFGLGYVYNMSKRTSLYTSYGRIDNNGSVATGARLVTTGSGPAVTQGGKNSTGYEFGIRHDF